jgi:hypothetical protein
MLEKLVNLDRRIIFVMVALAVLIPLLFPLNIPIAPLPGGPVDRAYQYLEKRVPEGGTVLMSFDYDPATFVELDPMAVAMVKHCFQRNIKIVAMALWPQGATMAENVFKMVKDTSKFELVPVDRNGVTRSVVIPAGKTAKYYGKDYVNLGYKAGQILVIQSMAKDLQNTFPLDSQGVSIKQFDLTKNIRGFDGFDLLIDFSAGDPGIPVWVQVAATQFNKPLIGGCTAVSAPGFTPYLQAGQLKGLMGGMRGAADYEVLLKAPGTASRGMDAQSIAHLLIIFFIVISNIFFFTMSRREGK